ncbi:hypothetical protein SPI_06815 [Niveomyces insectorum RCEF 264]|uniref:Uncharacterized protein n=1 Tax=Niveomyces insectorum RCEF 264 TaxID=1081102 RepID=A0A167QSI0_9HYPO|nr:hypothetical protein SPI_06815 [Niveomyces insectorum RCEF 264]
MAWYDNEEGEDADELAYQKAMDKDDDNALASFAGPLFIRGDEDNTFRVKNKSLSDWERRNVLERLTKATEIRCLLLGVVHGTLNTKAKSPRATLMVFKFRFDTIKHARRMTRARIDIEFFAKKKGDEAPEVLAVAPNERWSVVPTEDREKLSAGGKVKAGVSGVPFVDLGAEVSLRKTWSKDISDATTVTGGTHLGENIDAGAPTACGWTLLENKKRQTGLPDSLTVAVLVTRTNDKPFHAMVNLEARGNIRTEMDWMLNKIPVDDPVLFNPSNAQQTKDEEDEEDEEDEDEENEDVENEKEGNEEDEEEDDEEEEDGENEEDWEEVEADEETERTTTRRSTKRGKGKEQKKSSKTPEKKKPKKVSVMMYGHWRLGRWQAKMDKLADVTFRTVYKRAEKERW